MWPDLGNVLRDKGPIYLSTSSLGVEVWRSQDPLYVSDALERVSPR